MTDPTDRELVLRTRGGETEAYGEIVQRYQDSVFNVCLRMLGDRYQAEDLAQDSFIRAFERLGSFDVERPFGPWIRTVATNLCLNHLQRRRAIQVPLDDERDQPVSSQPEPERRLELQETVERTRRAIAEMPPHYRAVIELRHYQELSYAEISEALHLPLSDVKSHLYRARRKLAELLSSHA